MTQDDQEAEPVSGEIRLQIAFEKVTNKHIGPDDFQILKLIGKGMLFFLQATCFSHAT